MPATSRRRSFLHDIGQDALLLRLLNVKLKVAVSSPVSTASATKRKSTVFSEAEKLVTRQLALEGSILDDDRQGSVRSYPPGRLR